MPYVVVPQLTPSVGRMQAWLSVVLAGVQVALVPLQSWSVRVRVCTPLVAQPVPASQALQPLKVVVPQPTTTVVPGTTVVPAPGSTVITPVR